MITEEELTNLETLATMAVGNFPAAVTWKHFTTAVPRLVTEVRQLRGILAGQRTGTLGGNGSHWQGCWHSHIDCAEREIERLQSELAATREWAAAWKRTAKTYRR